MEAYRDQYATLFNNGRGVVVVGISADADTTLASWAREMDFPMLFVTDREGVVGKLYGAFNEARGTDDRSLFVVGPDGIIAHTARPFRVLSAPDYERLGEAVDRLAPPPEAEPDDGG
ncbi:MAG TPA: redoxin domain-containing protein [Gemmatimonadaceae bacterium]